MEIKAFISEKIEWIINQQDFIAALVAYFVQNKLNKTSTARNAVMEWYWQIGTPINSEM